MTGFRKRKNERRKEAQEKLELQLKEEKRRIKMEAKESYKKMTKSYQPIPELEAFLEEKEYDTENVTVKVVELSKSDLALQQNWIGENRPRYSDDEDDSTKRIPTKPESDDSEEEEVPGMGLTKKPIKFKPSVDSDKDGDDDDDEDGKGDKGESNNFTNKKDIQKAIKRQVKSSIKKSKAFQTKNKIVALKDKKKSRKLKTQKMKFKNDQAKKRGGGRSGGGGAPSGPPKKRGKPDRRKRK